MTIDTETLRKCAEVMGKKIHPIGWRPYGVDGPSDGEVRLIFDGDWNPEENPAQMEEIIDRLIHHESAIRPGISMYEIDAVSLLAERAKQYARTSDTWKQSIIRAVAAIGEER